MLNFDGGYVFFLFGRKERTKEKSFMSFFRICYLNSNVFGMGYIREAATLSCAV